MQKSKSKKFKLTVAIAIVAVVLVICLILPTGSLLAKPQKDASIKTNKEDYSPGSTVIMLGKNFEPNTFYEIVVIRPDGSTVLGDGSFDPGSDIVLTNSAGVFNYHYKLNGIDGLYTIEVKDLAGNIVATGTFTDATVRW